MSNETSVIFFANENLASFKASFDSLENQTIKPFEIIIVRPSGVSYSELTLSMPDCIIKWVDANGPDLRTQLLVAMPEVTGLYTTFLTEGAQFNASRIARCVEELEKNSSEIAFSYVTIQDSNGRQLSNDTEVVAQYLEATLNEFSNAPTVGCALMNGDLVFTLSNVFCRTEVLTFATGLSDSSLYAGLDIVIQTLPFFEPLLIKEHLLTIQIDVLNAPLRFRGNDKALLKIIETYFAKVEGKTCINQLAPSSHNWPNTIAFSKARQVRMGVITPLNDFNVAAAPQSVVNDLATSSNSSATKFTLISHDLSLSGAPKVIYDIAKLLRENSANVKVVALKGGPMRAELSRINVKAKVVPGKLLNWPYVYKFKKLILLLELLWFLIWNTDGKVVVNSAVCWPVVLPLCFIARFRPVAFYIHESLSIYSFIPSGLPVKAFRWIAKSKSISLWFGSDATRKLWLKDGFEGQTLYWSGLKSRKARESKSLGPNVILSVGTISARKGSNFLVEAFLKLLKEGRIPIDSQLHLVGFPENANAFTNDLYLKISLSPFANNIKMIDSLLPEMLEEHMQNADLYVQSSIMECLPISLLQAMSYGLPIITTNIDGCVEAIQDGHNGYLCLPRSINSLASAIEKIFHDLQKAEQMGKQAQKDFNSKFSLNSTKQFMLQELLALK